MVHGLHTIVGWVHCMLKIPFPVRAFFERLLDTYCKRSLFLNLFINISLKYFQEKLIWEFEKLLSVLLLKTPTQKFQKFYSKTDSLVEVTNSFIIKNIKTTSGSFEKYQTRLLTHWSNFKGKGEVWWKVVN